MSAVGGDDRVVSAVGGDDRVPGTAGEDHRVEPVVVDILDHHGRVTARQRIVVDPANPRFTVGRSVLADVLVDDPHVAPIHVDISVQPDGAIIATDRGSINGFFVGRERHRDATGVRIPSGRLQVGRTQLAVHTLRRPLPPEQPDLGFDRTGSFNKTNVAIGGAIACIALSVYFAWVGAPRDLLTQLIIGVAGGALIAAIWIAFWTLLSRIIRGDPRWLMHTAIAFSVTAIGLVADTVLDVARFAFALPQWAMGGTSLLVLTFAVALYLHLTQVWTLKRRTGAALAVVLPVLIFGTISWVQDRSEARNVNFIGVKEKVFPPALRLRDGITLDRYFAGSGQLREAADNKRKDIPADDTGPEAEEE